MITARSSVQSSPIIIVYQYKILTKLVFHLPSLLPVSRSYRRNLAKHSAGIGSVTISKLPCKNAAPLVANIAARPHPFSRSKFLPRTTAKCSQAQMCVVTVPGSSTLSIVRPWPLVAALRLRSVCGAPTQGVTRTDTATPTATRHGSSSSVDAVRDCQFVSRIANRRGITTPRIALELDTCLLPSQSPSVFAYFGDEKCPQKVV